LLCPAAELRPDSRCGCVCCGIPNPLVTQHVAGELGLGFGNAGSALPVHGVDLAQQEEIPDCRHCESTSYEEEKDSREDVTAALLVELGDGGDDAAASRAGDAEGHDDGVEELQEEHEEEHHEVEGGVGSEGFIGRSEPAKKRDGDGESSVQNRKSKNSSIVASGEEHDDSSKQVCHHEACVKEPQIVETLYHLLELHRDVHIDVLVEAWLAGHEGG